MLQTTRKLSTAVAPMQARKNNKKHADKASSEDGNRVPHVATYVAQIHKKKKRKTAGTKKGKAIHEWQQKQTAIFFP